jgi:hypothetical protein
MKVIGNYIIDLNHLAIENQAYLEILNENILKLLPGSEEDKNSKFQLRFAELLKELTDNYKLNRQSTAERNKSRKANKKHGKGVNNLFP